MGYSINQFLQELGSGASIKDYQHASKIFVDDNYRLSPKYSFLFHVAFDINSELSRLPRDEQLEMGMLVKSVNLPKFTIDTKTLNAYNRKNIVQNKINYDPVTITFHDDSGDVVRDFWYDYMSYYYRDSDYTPPVYGQPHKYNNRQTQDWGYKPARYGSTASGAPERMLKAIRIYSLHQKRFTEYVLINPTITNFSHGEHQNGQNDVMTHSMTVTYETVLYNYGWVNPGVNTNFATLHYDKSPSPLTPQGGGTKSILGPGGLLSAIDGIDNQLGQNPPNVLGAGLMAYKAFQNFKGANLGQMATAELSQIGMDILRGNNPLNRLQIPSLGGLLGSGGVGSVGVVGTGASLLGSLFGSQKGGPGSPSGASPNGTVAATQATQVGLTGGTTSPGAANGSNPDVAGKISSNGEGIGGSTGTGSTAPTGVVSKNADGSTSQTNPVTGQTTQTFDDGSTITTDSKGAVVSSTDSTGKLTGQVDPATGEWSTDVSSANQIKQNDEGLALFYGDTGSSPTINNNVNADVPSNQGESADPSPQLPSDLTNNSGGVGVDF